MTSSVGPRLALIYAAIPPSLLPPSIYFDPFSGREWEGAVADGGTPSRTPVEPLTRALATDVLLQTDELAVKAT